VESGKSKDKLPHKAAGTVKETTAYAELLDDLRENSRSLREFLPEASFPAQSRSFLGCIT